MFFALAVRSQFRGEQVLCFGACSERTAAEDGVCIHYPRLRSSGVTKISSLRDYDVAGCKPARSIARGKVRGTSTATPGMRMSRVFGRGAWGICDEAQHLLAAKGKKL